MARIQSLCLHCGKQISVAQWQLKSGRGKFCSTKCRKEYPSVLKGRSFGGKVERICEKCGKKFLTRKSQLKIGTGRFCSRSCNSKSHTGENAHNWKGGRLDDYNAVRLSIKGRLWRQSVFIRDKFTCQKCGDNKGGNLHAHHIKRFSILLEEVRNYMPLLPFVEACMIYDPLWDIVNGITVCGKCHKKEHSIDK